MIQFLFICLLLSTVSGFSGHSRLDTRKTSLFVESSDAEKGVDPNWHDCRQNPYWQDIYDADCTMDSIFSARFVASEWIKELPCASGMEDCDFPADALLPEMRPESHTQVDVLDFLNIKRVHQEDNSNLSP